MKIVFWLIVVLVIGSLGYRGCKKINEHRTPAESAEQTPEAEEKKEDPGEAAAREAERAALMERIARAEALAQQATEQRDLELQARAEQKRREDELAREIKEEEKKRERGFVTHLFENREVPTREEIGELLPGQYFVDADTNQIIAAVEDADEMLDVSDLLRGLDRAPEKKLYRVDAVICTAELVDSESFSLEWLAKWGNIRQPWKAQGTVSAGAVSMDSDWFDLALERARTAGKLSISSRPHLVLSRGESAKVSSGRDVPLPTLNVSDGNAQSGIEYRKVALETTCVLREVGSGAIAVEITQVAAQIAGSATIGTTQVPEVSSQEWQTRLLPNLGEWYAVGGVAIERAQVDSLKGFFHLRKKSSTKQRQEFGMFVRVTEARNETRESPGLRAEPLPRAIPVKGFFQRREKNMGQE